MAKWYEKPWRVAKAITTGGGSEGGAIKNGIGSVYSDVSGRNQARAALKAAQIQAEMQQKALDENKRQFDTSQANLQPWLQTGQRALGSLESQLNSGAYNMPDYQAGTYDVGQAYDPGAAFGYDKFQFNPGDLQNDPGYQFQLQQGTRALDQGAAARGGALGGNQARALTQYGQGLGAQSYGDAYTRALQGYQTNYGTAFNNYSMNNTNRQNAYNINQGNRQSAFNTNEANRLGGYQQNQQNRQQQFGRYSQLAGLGQQSAGQLGQLGANFANQQANAYGNIGDAQAGGMLGAANARANGTGNLVNFGLQTLPLFV